MKIDIGCALKELREERGLTQRYVANSAGLGRSALCLIEKGERFPSIPSLVMLSCVLELQMSSVILRAESIPERPPKPSQSEGVAERPKKCPTCKSDFAAKRNAVLYARPKNRNAICEDHWHDVAGNIQRSNRRNRC